MRVRFMWERSEFVSVGSDGSFFDSRLIERVHELHKVLNAEISMHADLDTSLGMLGGELFQGEWQINACQHGTVECDGHVLMHEEPDGGRRCRISSGTGDWQRERFVMLEQRCGEQKDKHQHDDQIQQRRDADLSDEPELSPIGEPFHARALGEESGVEGAPLKAGMLGLPSDAMLGSASAVKR